MEYLKVHLYWTIPPTVLLAALFAPLATPVDVFRITALVIIAVVSATPWDSYLIRTKVWSYPSSGVLLGPSLFSIPIEEYGFFVIQTVLTSLCYLLLSKPVLHACYRPTRSRPLRPWAIPLGFAIIISSIVTGVWLTYRGGEGRYLGLVLVWSSPFILFLWTLSASHIISLPLHATLLAILLPTVHLCLLDTFALQRGTWVIQTGTKLDIYIWSGLEIEEALFFFITSILITFGQIAFDHALTNLTLEAVLTSSPVPSVPSVALLMHALIGLNVKARKGAYDVVVDQLRGASETLKGKSRSFWLASAVFEGPVRVDLIRLYAFCRVADDLIDERSNQTRSDAMRTIGKIRSYLDEVYSSSSRKELENGEEMQALRESFGGYLPDRVVPRGPIEDLLEGFEMDLAFLDRSGEDEGEKPRLAKYPIKDEKDLKRYCYCVASTIAEMCLHLIFHYVSSAEEEYPLSTSTSRHTHSKIDPLILDAAHNMGMALQLVNIARDIELDLAEGRVYIPTSWWTSSPSPTQIFAPTRSEIRTYRARLLKLAFELYRSSIPALSIPAGDVKEKKGGGVPKAFGARRGLKVAVESYMEIGRVLMSKVDDEIKVEVEEQWQMSVKMDVKDGRALNGKVSSEDVRARRGRASVNVWRRVWVAWRTLMRG